jgi:hypothetical protein
MASVTAQTDVCMVHAHNQSCFFQTVLQSSAEPLTAAMPVNTTSLSSITHININSSMAPAHKPSLDYVTGEDTAHRLPQSLSTSSSIIAHQLISALGRLDTKSPWNGTWQATCRHQPTSLAWNRVNLKERNTPTATVSIICVIVILQTMGGQGSGFGASGP